MKTAVQEKRGVDQSSQSLLESMKVESNRLHTFKTWPASVPVKPEHLAADGFYYLGIGDRVKCRFCDVTISQWKEGDVISDDHIKFSPSCPFVNGKNVGNERTESSSAMMRGESGFLSNISDAGSMLTAPIDVPWSSSGASNSNRSYDSGYSSASSRSVSSDSHVIRKSNQSNLSGIMESFPSLNSSLPKPPNASSLAEKNSLSSSSVLLNPKHPKHMLESSRLETFTNWPISVKQTPKQMAEAGFYYLSTGDRVKCFCCDGNLMNWDPEDNPLIEHERFYPVCSYLKLVKNSLLEQIQKEKEMNEKNRIPPKVLAVVDFGFSYDFVKTLLTRHNKCFDHFHNADSLLNFILDKERKQHTLQEDGLSEAQIDQILREEEPMELRMDTPDGCSGISHPTDDSSQNGHKKTNPQAKSKAKYITAIGRQNQKLKTLLACKKCKDKASSIIYLPCGHRITCETCAEKERNCGQCNKPIKGTVKSYLS